MTPGTDWFYEYHRSANIQNNSTKNSDGPQTLPAMMIDNRIPDLSRPGSGRPFPVLPLPQPVPAPDPSRKYRCLRIYLAP